MSILHSKAVIVAVSLLIALSSIYVKNNSVEAAAAIASGSNGAWGACWNHQTVQSAINCAMYECGKHTYDCKIYLTNFGPGYGAISKTPDNRLGFGAGYNSQYEANVGAQNAVGGGNIVATWYDTVKGY